MYPDLITRFTHLREELDRSLARHSTLAEENGASFSLEGVNQRYNAASELDEVTAEIRQQPGFEDFSLPLKEEKLLEAARDGPVTVINVSEPRSRLFWCASRERFDMRSMLHIFKAALDFLDILHRTFHWTVGISVNSNEYCIAFRCRRRSHFLE